MKSGDRLGRGLHSLLSGTDDMGTEEGTGQKTKKVYFNCDIAAIRPNPYQPRASMDDASLGELAGSIQEKGVIQPLLVRKVDGQEEYELIAGERRLRAAKLAGLLEVPVIVKEAEPEDRLELALIENIQRQNLNPIEEAVAYKRLVEEFHLTQEEAAKRVGKERSTVANIMRLLQLPEVIKEDLALARMSMGHARVLLSLPGEEEMVALRDRIIKEGLSVRQTEKMVAAQKRQKGKKKAPAIQNKKPIPESYCRTLSDDVARQLGNKTKIVQNGERGKLEIEYYSLDDLERIHKLLTSIAEAG